MPYQNTDPNGAKELLDSGEGWIYLDVRTPEEFAEGHPRGAYNVPIALADPLRGMALNPAFVEVVKKHFPNGSKLVVGCAMGGRSARACEILGAAGYGFLANVHGGFSGATDMSGAITQPGWQACGHPVESQCPPERSWAGLQEV